MVRLSQRATIGLICLSFTCSCTALSLGEVVHRIRSTSEALIQNDIWRISRTVHHQIVVSGTGARKQEDQDVPQAVTKPSPESPLPASTSKPKSTFKFLFEDLDNAPYDNRQGNSASPFNSKPQKGSSGLMKRQNSGVGNSGTGNSGNYNCGSYNSGNYNSGNGNSGNYNSGSGQSGNGNGGSSPCGNVVISQSVAYVYPAASTVVVQPNVVTSTIVYQQPNVYTTYAVYNLPAQTTVVYQQPQVIPIVTSETQLPRGCAYWESLGYRCSPGHSFSQEFRNALWLWMGFMSIFWGVIVGRVF